MNRRQFFKTIAATCAALVVAPSVVGKRTGRENDVSGKRPDGSVQWGRASCDVPADRHVAIQYVSPWSNPYPMFFGGAVIVETTTPIKKGQILVWNPDGTVRGA